MSNNTAPTIADDSSGETKGTTKENNMVGLGEKIKKYFKKHMDFLSKKEKKEEEQEQEQEQENMEGGTSTDEDSDEDTDQITPEQSTMFIGMMIFLVVWAIASIAALVYSLTCFGYSGNTIEKVIGVVIAFFTGPFYFIYYRYSNTYCKANGGSKKGGSSGTRRNGGRK
jgi:uncharacterized membrane protein YgcG